MNICGYTLESITEGEGLRSVVYISGCKHQCPGCFNTSTWNFKCGEEFTISMQMEIIHEIGRHPLVQGLTLCGGDPFFSAKDCVSFLKLFRLHYPSKDIWAYTGFMYEQICKDQEKKELLDLCDFLVDGKFILDKKDLTLFYRGSQNQRIIDIKRSNEKHPVLYKEPIE